MVICLCNNPTLHRKSLLLASDRRLDFIAEATRSLFKTRGTGHPKPKHHPYTCMEEISKLHLIKIILEFCCSRG